MNTSTFFNTVFSKAAKNAILILDEEGFILSVNDAFLKSFNYSTDKLIGKHFRMLFTEEARKNKKPEHELEQCKKTGSGNDENYLVCGDGTITWVSGESVYDSENKYCLKFIQNINTKKELEIFLFEAYDFIEIIFNSVNDIALLILSSTVKVVKVNDAFIRLFELEKEPLAGCRLSELDHMFWKDEKIRKEIINCLVNNKAIRDKKITIKNKAGEEREFIMNVKTLDSDKKGERNMIVMIK